MQASEVFDTLGILFSRLIRADFQGIQRLMRVSTLFHPNKIVWNFSHLDQLFNALDLDMPSPAPSVLERAEGPIPTEFTISGRNTDLATHIRARNVKGFVVLKDGQIRLEQYFHGTQASDRNISWSMSKSVTALLLGTLIDKGLIPEEALEYEIQDHIPDLKGSAYDGVRLIHVLNMASGVAFNEDYIDYHSDINRMGRIIGVGGSMDAFAATLGREWAPGRYMHYVSVDTHVIGMMIRALTGKKMIDLLNEHFVAPMAFEHSGFVVTDGEMEPFVLGGLNLSTRDYARIGQMMLQKGRWNGGQLIAADWVDRMTAPSAPDRDPESAAQPDGGMGYGMQWWLPPEATDGEFFGVGIYGQYIYVNRPCGVVIAQNAGDTEFRTGDGIVNVETLAMFRQIAEGLDLQP